MQANSTKIELPISDDEKVILIDAVCDFRLNDRFMTDYDAKAAALAYISPHALQS